MIAIAVCRECRCLTEPDISELCVACEMSRRESDRRLSVAFRWAVAEGERGLAGKPWWTA